MTNPPSDDKVNLKRRPIVIHIRGWYPISMMVLVMLLVSTANVFYTLHVDDKRAEADARRDRALVRAEREADQRWCKLLIPLDDSYQTDPRVQQSELGKRVAAAIHDIRAETGC